MKIQCKTCGRHLGDVEMILGELLCGNSACRGGSQFKILTSDTEKMLRFKFINPPKPAKKEIKDA